MCPVKFVQGVISMRDFPISERWSNHYRRTFPQLGQPFTGRYEVTRNAERVITTIQHCSAVIEKEAIS